MCCERERLSEESERTVPAVGNRKVSGEPRGGDRRRRTATRWAGPLGLATVTMLFGLSGEAGAADDNVTGYGVRCDRKGSLVAVDVVTFEVERDKTEVSIMCGKRRNGDRSDPASITELPDAYNRELNLAGFTGYVDIELDPGGQDCKVTVNPDGLDYSKPFDNKGCSSEVLLALSAVATQAQRGGPGIV